MAHFFIGTTNYSYDNKDQLLNETSTRYSPRNDQFGYDAMGNPTSWKGSTRSFNANNQETTGGGSQFAYDGNGNATTYKGNTLTYDEENHMTSFTTPSGATPLRAVYRSDGLRGWKQVSSGNRYFFLYDGDQIVCGFDGNGDLSRINVWGASGLIGRQSGTNGGTPVYDYAWDDKGNISQVLNTNSSVASNYLVSAWGEASTDSAAYDPYRCMGGQYGNYFDAETGLILCGQRYYDPSGGRWLTRDPIGYEGGLNVYGYVGNNPTNFVDPDGLDATAIIVHVGGDLLLKGAAGLAFGVGTLLIESAKPTSSNDTMVAYNQAQKRQLAIRRYAALMRRTKKLPNEFYERFGSKGEATECFAAQKLSPRPAPHQNQPKWIAEVGRVDPRTLGKSENYTHRMLIVAKPGTRAWLQQFQIKSNELGRYAIPASRLSEFNTRVVDISISKRR